MITKIFTFLVAATLISSQSFAKIFRVGYLGPQVAGVDYANGQSAHDAAASGDTIQFYGGSYEINQYNKKLYLLGNGYLLSGTGSNAGLNVITAKTSITIQPAPSSTGSDGTTLTGFQDGVVYLTDGATLSNITISRCNTAYFGGGPSQTATLTNCKITQCFSANIDPSNGWGNTNIRLKDFRVENCRLNSSSITHLNPVSNILISNCVFASGSDFSNLNVTVQNSVFANSTPMVGVSNAIFNNNILGAPDGINGSNNVFNVNILGVGSNIFVGFPTQGSYSNDGSYQLTPSSIAKGAGIGGIDIGIFGGVNPYRLSGIPATPSFYRLDAASPNATTNPYTINFSIRSNN